MQLEDLRIKHTTDRLALATVAGFVAGFAFYLSTAGFVGAVIQLPLPTGGMRVGQWFFVMMFFFGFAAASLGGGWSFWRLTPGDHGGFLWRWERRRRQERGVCLWCEYDLRGSDVRCPECGTEFSD